MNKMFTQPTGPATKETNKEAIARIFGLKKSQVGYLSATTPVDSYTILFDRTTQTCWYRGTATGTPTSWSVSGSVLTLTTSSGVFNLILADLRQNLISTEDGYGSELVGFKRSEVYEGTVAAYLNKATSYLTPEMFGAVGDGSVDDSDAIILANTTARTMGINEVRGFGTYLIGKGIPCISSQNSVGDTVLYGFRLELNRVIVTDDWDALPDDWWNATPAFYSAGSTAGTSTNCEAFELYVNEFVGKWKAHFCASINSGFNISHIHCGVTRQHVIGYKCLGDGVSQAPSNRITGIFWQTGYIGCLIGGSMNGSGGGQCEAHTIEIDWCATNRYGGVILCDGSRYASIKGGTYDYNGQYTSLINLIDLSAGNTIATESANRFVFEFGKTIQSTDGTVTGVALGQIIWFNYGWWLLVSESESVTNGTSQWAGLTIQNEDGSFTATVSDTLVPNSTTGYYNDIYVCHRLAAFSRTTVNVEYFGGFAMHAEYSNRIWAPHPSNSLRRRNTIGPLGVTGGYTELNMYANNMSYYLTPFQQITESGVNFNQPVLMNNVALSGRKATLAIPQGKTTNVFTFVAAGSETVNRMYLLTVSANASAMYGLYLVRVGVSAITVTDISHSGGFTLSSDGLKLQILVSSGAFNVTFNAQRLGN